MIIEKQRFGRGLIREISKYVYKNPIVVYREAVSNALDAMDPYREQEKPRVKIYTNQMPDGDIVIEDWGTGIENYEEFLTIAEGEKRVRGEVSSYEKVSNRIIGQKGMGKMSFLSMSSVNRIEFFSNNEKLGFHIILTDDPNDVKIEPMNSQLALPHHGLKVVIKRAKKIIPEGRVIEYLSKVFALRIARGAKIFVNDKQVNKPEPFEPDQGRDPLFELNGGTKIYGVLKHVDKPKTDNIDIFVKKIFVCSKGFGYKVEGWLNCDQLEPITSRDEVYEGNEVYADFMTKLMSHIDENFEKKIDNIEKHVKSEKALSSLIHLYRILFNQATVMNKRQC
jgi:Histidine kinase-, DNA gyrase B-, and HSP90-like ATPase